MREELLGVVDLVAEGQELLAPKEQAVEQVRVVEEARAGKMQTKDWEGLLEVLDWSPAVLEGSFLVPMLGIGLVRRSHSTLLAFEVQSECSEPELWSSLIVVMVVLEGFE